MRAGGEVFLTPTTYAGRPAVLDTVARVFYACATHTRAREWARELNEGK